MDGGRWVTEQSVGVRRDEPLGQCELRYEMRERAGDPLERRVRDVLDGLFEERVRRQLGERRPCDATTPPIGVACPALVRQVEELDEWQCALTGAEVHGAPTGALGETESRDRVRDIGSSDDVDGGPCDTWHHGDEPAIQEP